MNHIKDNQLCDFETGNWIMNRNKSLQQNSRAAQAQGELRFINLPMGYQIAWMIFHSNVVTRVRIIFRCFAKETSEMLQPSNVRFQSAYPNLGKRLGVLFCFSTKRRQVTPSNMDLHNSSLQTMLRHLDRIFRDLKNDIRELNCTTSFEPFLHPVSVSFLSFPCEYKLFLTFEFICFTLQYWDPITIYKIIMITEAFVHYRLFNLLGRQNVSEWKFCDSSLPPSIGEKKNSIV